MVRVADELYGEYLEIIRKAKKHNDEFCNNWPWKEKEITAIAVRAAFVLDHAQSEARVCRRASTNAARIGNQKAACYFSDKAIAFDVAAQEALSIIDNIDTWHRLQK